jgi:hypothetical protein
MALKNKLIILFVKMGNLKLGGVRFIFIALYVTPWYLSMKIPPNVQIFT